MEIEHNGLNSTFQMPVAGRNGNNPSEKKLRLKQRLVAEYAARGLPPTLIAHEVRLTPNTVRIIMRDEGVRAEISRIASEIFEEGDRLLVNLYRKALSKLDAHLENTENLDIADKAIDKVLKCHGYNRDGEGGIIGRLFPSEQKEPFVSIDELIIRKRRERGLEV